MWITGIICNTEDGDEYCDKPALIPMDIVSQIVLMEKQEIDVLMGKEIVCLRRHNFHTALVQAVMELGKLAGTGPRPVLSDEI